MVRGSRAVASHVTERAIAAERAESRIRRRRLLEYLIPQQPGKLEGQITMVVERGFSVDLPSFGTWGFVPVDALPRGPYRYAAGSLRGPDRTFRLGAMVEVEIGRIDAAANELELRPI